MKDLFETPELWSTELAEVEAIFSERSGGDDVDYRFLSEMLEAFERVGYTFEYYLDAVPYALRPIGTPLSEIDGFEDESDN